MKKILYFILCLILCAGIGGSAFAFYKNFGSETNIEQPADSSADKDTNDENSETEDTGTSSTGGNIQTDDVDDGGANDSGSIVLTGLTAPANEASLIADGLEMMAGASVYLGDDDSLDPAIRFTCLVENTLVEEVEADENKSLAILLAPLDYFDQVNTNSYTYIDWVNVFAEAGKTVMLNVFDGYGTYDDDTSYMRFNLANVMYRNMNRKFVAMGVLIDNSGSSPVYKYSAFPDGLTYRTNARSVAYVSGAALNAYALGLDSFSDEHLAKLYSYIDMAVDDANGLAESTDDGSLPTLTITSGTSLTLGTSGSYALSWEMSPEIDVPIRFYSFNDSVVTVDSDGVIRSVAKGSTTVGVYIAGVAYNVSVTVSTNVQYV